MHSHAGVKKHYQLRHACEGRHLILLFKINLDREHHGLELKSVNSSHRIYVKPGLTFRISVPVNSNEELKLFT